MRHSRQTRLWRSALCGIILAAGCGVSRGPNDAGGHARDLGALDAEAAPADLATGPQPDLPPPVQCLAGHYVGTFTGMILLGNIVPIDTHGSVDLTLGSSGGEFFEVMNGHLMGTASGKNPYSADLVGTLDCAKLQLTGGMIKNGKVTVSGITYMFEGPIAADYDPNTTAFVNGTWNIKEIPKPGSSGKGTWTAKHM